MISNFFSDLFSSSGSDDSEIINSIVQKVSDSQNFMLTREFREQEVADAIKSMHPDKSPGPDGFNPGFFQKFWPEVGKKVTEACLLCLNSCTLPDDLNNTLIVLIPKVKKPGHLTDLRPISLCNVIIKIMTKVLANRLKLVLDGIISENQSAFIPGRLITDNALIAFEISHYLKHRKRGKIGFASLKIDMSKAYDRVEWSFLENMMKLGFAHKWVSLVMLFVRSVKYSILSPGGNIGPIIPERGLRQGDPISPYLFLICAEGLSAFIQKQHREGLIHGCNISKLAPEVSHLFFADDSFLFFRANIQEGDRINYCLKEYEKASGQKINLNKSSISFSANVSDQVRQDISSRLGVQITTNHGKYLGLPSLVGRKKKENFNFLKEKAVKKMRGWRFKKFNKSGKEILLKSVVQTFPSYVMNLFLLPSTLCAEIEVLMNGFYWGGGTPESTGIRWKSWDRLCTHKNKGGLGFRDLHKFNIALLAKQAWRLVSKPDSLAATILKARYYPRKSFFEATTKGNPSFVWRSILASKDLVRRGTRWRIGMGTEVKVWGEAWLKDDANPYIESPCPDGLENPTVSSLRLGLEEGWDIPLLKDLFTERDYNCIISIYVSVLQVPDKLIWTDDNKGVYSVRSGYRKLMEENQVEQNSATEIDWNKLWKVKLPPKMKTHMWRVLFNSLPTKQALIRKKVDIPATCPLCNAAEESAIHLIKDCAFARAVWRRSVLNFSSNTTQNLAEWWNLATGNFSLEEIVDFISICWAIWYARNCKVWKNEYKPPSFVLSFAASTRVEWQKAQTLDKDAAATVRGSKPGEKWAKPQVGFTKHNVDASIYTSQKAAGYGIVARSSEGKFVAALQGYYQGQMDPLIAEAIGLCEALSWIKRRGDDLVIVESDSKVLVDRFHSDIPDYSEVGLIIQDGKALISGLHQFELRFVRRSANEAAHNLARVAYLSSGQTEWGLSPPSCICNALETDLS